MAKDGWRYREAYFVNHDGKHYGLTLSVAYGRNGKVAYNIANIKERSFPQIYGSSNPRTGAQGGEPSLRETIPQSGEKSNTKKETQMCMHTGREGRCFRWVYIFLTASGEYSTRNNTMS